MNRKIWIGVIVVIVLVAGGWLYLNQSSVSKTSTIQSPTGQPTQQDANPKDGVQQLSQISTTKTNLGGGYLKNSSHVYFDVTNPQIIPGADPNSFFVVSTDFIGKDNQHVYSLGQVLVGADPKTFVDAGDGTYWKDSSHVWILPAIGKGNLVLLPDADVRTFVYLGNANAKDASHTYGLTAKGYPAIEDTRI